MIEIFGQREHAGPCEDVDRFGGKMLDIIVVGTDGGAIQDHLYGGGSIFSRTHCTEATAKRLRMATKRGIRW